MWMWMTRLHVSVRNTLSHTQRDELEERARTLRGLRLACILPGVPFRLCWLQISLLTFLR